MAPRNRALLCFALFILTFSLVQVCMGLFEWDQLLANSFENFEKKSMKCDADPDICRNVTELLTSKGYPCEEHIVETSDGFLLSLQHVPHGRKSPEKKTSRPVVFLQHGLLCSSADWVLNPVNQSLGMILADSGFDVWMGNIRGNTYSNRHVKLDPSTKQFWAWSWDEMARFDLTAMLEYALQQSGQQQLYYIGHSQGTLIAFAQFGNNQTLAKKVRRFYALGPVSTVGHIEGPMRYLSYFTKDIEDLFALFGLHQFLPSSTLLKFLAATFCTAPSRIVCEDILFLIAGPDSKQFNQSRVPVYVSHDPAGTSVRNMVHFAQMVRSGLFQMYDFGSPEENKLHYGQSSPPMYNASNVKIPVELFSAGKDTLADPWDVKSLASQLPMLEQHYKYETWNHLDFLWAMQANTQVYQKIIDSINYDHATLHAGKH